MEGKRDRLVRFERQEQTIKEVRKLNSCEGPGKPCGTYCTLYPSASGTPVETFIFPGGHLYPPPGYSANREVLPGKPAPFVRLCPACPGHFITLDERLH